MGGSKELPPTEDLFCLKKNMTKLILFILPFLAILLIIFSVFFYKIKTSKWPYLKKEYLLTQAEKNFYFILSEILGNDYLIFSKVRMADLLYLPSMSNSHYYHYQNKIKSKHVDFLICDKVNIKPLLVIELDDSSHKKVDRILRDTLVDKIFENAKLPILHIKNSSSYDREKLNDQIEAIIV
jgi:hypothetical protein